MMSLFARLGAGAALAAFAVLGTAHAAGFEVAVSPSRFEVSAKAAQRLGQSITIHNLGATPTDVALRTLDWTFSPEGSVSYHDELLAGSCRPWVTLERRSLRVPAQGRSSLRFQVDVPADAPRGECRFMLAVEGIEPAYQAQLQGGSASLSLPVSGRIAVAVYVMVGGAEPKLQIEQFGVKDINGKRTPVVTVSNKGDAHGRLDGGLESVDAKGQKFDLVPESTPIMPGQTRTLPLAARGEPNQKPPEFTLPVRGKGQLDWEQGSFKLDVEFK